MASISDEFGTMLTDGLQGSDTCDEAIKAAQQLAAQRGKAVYLSDDDGDWTVLPDGTADPTALDHA